MRKEQTEQTHTIFLERNISISTTTESIRCSRAMSSSDYGRFSSLFPRFNFTFKQSRPWKATRNPLTLTNPAHPKVSSPFHSLFDSNFSIFLTKFFTIFCRENFESKGKRNEPERDKEVESIQIQLRIPQQEQIPL